MEKLSQLYNYNTIYRIAIVVILGTITVIINDYVGFALLGQLKQVVITYGQVKEVPVSAGFQLMCNQFVGFAATAFAFFVYSVTQQCLDNLFGRTNSTTK